MTLSDRDREALIQHHIDKSSESICQVKFLIENNQLSLAVNRIYYGVYYILSALAIKNRFKTSKHEQLIGWFNKIYIKGNLVDKRYSKIIRKFHENRMEGDYNVFSEFLKEEVEESFAEMQDMIGEIRKLLVL
jgi:uncharacterized protein (UPF0332 family)